MRWLPFCIVFPRELPRMCCVHYMHSAPCSRAARSIITRRSPRATNPLPRCFNLNLGSSKLYVNNKLAGKPRGVVCVRLLTLDKQCFIALFL